MPIIFSGEGYVNEVSSGLAHFEPKQLAEMSKPAIMGFTALLVKHGVPIVNEGSTAGWYRFVKSNLDSLDPHTSDTAFDIDGRSLGRTLVIRRQDNTVGLSAVANLLGEVGAYHPRGVLHSRVGDVLIMTKLLELSLQYNFYESGQVMLEAQIDGSCSVADELWDVLQLDGLVPYEPGRNVDIDDECVGPTQIRALGSCLESLLTNGKLS